jgi:hypothetical protein
MTPPIVSPRHLLHLLASKLQTAAASSSSQMAAKF